MKTTSVGWVAGLLLSTAAAASIQPKSQGKDRHMVQVSYDPTNVISVHTRVGVVTLIQLPPGETLGSDHGGIALGDALAWGVQVRGNNIFLKPKAKQPQTNLTVVSDQRRTYAFALTTRHTPFYRVKVERAPTASAPKEDRTPCRQGPINTDYQKWGDTALAPQYAWDDGRFTCLKFATNAELPVAYQISPDGQESLVNYHLKQDTLVLHSIAHQYRLRLGQQVLGLQSKSAKFAGFNRKASTIRAARQPKESGL